MKRGERSARMAFHMLGSGKGEREKEVAMVIEESGNATATHTQNTGSTHILRGLSGSESANLQGSGGK